MTKIAPSILSADFSCLGDEIKKVDDNGADLIHIDVMDGHFVPNITIGPGVVKCIRKVTEKPFDVHLMVANPDDFIEQYAQAGADIITVHVEASKHLNRTIQIIKSCGKKVGVALNPATPLTMLDYVLQDVDMVLLMTVNPGFGGQSYIKFSTRKIESLKNMIIRNTLNIDIEVDGGIDATNIDVVTKAGANIIVAGSAIYNKPDIGEAIKQLKMNAFKRNYI
ncbi:MAG: ribulose-phosphate 3-epimerase [Ruminiclostridium sp.]